MPLKNPVTEPQVPSEIARDAEVTAAINSHEAATDPHPQYLLQSEGDGRYEYRTSLASKTIAGPVTFPANTWTSLGAFAGFPFGLQGSPSAIIVGASFCFNIAAPWQQACFAALLGPCWWQPATVNDSGTRVWLENHNATGFFLWVRTGLFSGDLRPVQIFPESTISIPSSGRVDVAVKRLI